jgi:homopolymeric O-antigen transport system ATP-binding protein
LGRPAMLLTIGAGFEMDLTGRENIYLNAALLGHSRRWIDHHMEDIIEFSELDGFIDVSLRKYSTGMRARLGFSVAAHSEPDTLLIDEVLNVGDESFRAKSRAKLMDMMGSAMAIVVVTHDLKFVKETCTKALWLHEGRVAGWGPIDDVVDAYARTAREATGPVRAISGRDFILGGASGEPGGGVRGN